MSSLPILSDHWQGVFLLQTLAPSAVVSTMGGFDCCQCYRGLYDEAEALTQFSLDIARSVYKHDENQTMLRRHRSVLHDGVHKP